MYIFQQSESSVVTLEAGVSTGVWHMKEEESQGEPAEKVCSCPGLRWIVTRWISRQDSDMVIPLIFGSGITHLPITISG